VYGLTRHNWLNGVLAGITLAMAVIPEEFPVVLTIFLALGAWRIAQKRVLTRKVPAVETLGSATVLCVDKTGTITQNRMSVQLLCFRGRCIEVDAGERTLPEPFHPLVEFSVLASRRNPFDPMEKAFAALCEKTLVHTEHVHYNWELVQEYPLEPQLLAMSRVWRSPAGHDYVIAAKGSPESVIELCHLPDNEVRQLMEEVRRMAEKGLRVLGVARSSYFSGSPLPGRQHAFDFEFLGFIGLADPVRPEVPAAIRECHTAGIRVVMITGDYPETAKNIAAQIGLRNSGQCLTGAELDAQGGIPSGGRLRSVNIFARVAPAQKLLIVQALKKNGEVTAMTGDGVNDAPALKAADIGIAMGGRGTDVAREAASLVLLDDDFSSIVTAVRMGRRVYDNIRKAMSYILAVHVTIAGMAVLPVIFQLPLVLLPVHIVFLQLIIDPASSIAFEAEPAEPDIMERPPRAAGEPVFGKQAVILSLLQGISVLGILVAVYVLALYLGGSEDNARALTFTTLIVANLGLILTNRSWSKTMLESFSTRNTALFIVLAGTVVVLAAVLYVPFLQRLFHFGTLHLIDLLISLAAGLIGILWFERLKVLHAVRTTERREANR
jgi:Ca2+-transporting ATPase